MQFLEQFRNFYQSLNKWQDLRFDFLMLALILGLIFIGFILSITLGLASCERHYLFPTKLIEQDMIN